jgi:hypothetical protein
VGTNRMKKMKWIPKFPTSCLEEGSV